MENVKNENQENILNEIKETKVANTHKGFIDVNIRRTKKSIIPGAGPEEMVIKIGGSLDVKSRKSLKGLSGDLETKYMPKLINESINSGNFQQRVEEYWNSLSVVVPHDEETKKESEQGYKLYFEYKVNGDHNYKQLTSEKPLEDRINILNNLIEKDSATIIDDYIASFALLNYCLKYKLVANKVEDINKSDKIMFYIYDKPLAIKASIAKIESKALSWELFAKVKQNQKHLIYILMMFKQDIKQYPTIEDKIIRVDELRNISETEMVKFNKFANELDWEERYLIEKAVLFKIVTNPLNTTSYYYNSNLLGASLTEVVENFKEDGYAPIKQAILAELKQKV